jgi:glycosyltransferase involved in cell wall biosynthesis
MRETTKQTQALLSLNNISVIIPTYQHAGTLPQCLDSILNQTVKPIEIIVVDDGSTDGTEEVMQPYLDRVTYIKQQNAGAPVARNNGFKNSTGEYVIFWDADIVGRPHMLESMLHTLGTHSEASWAYCRFRWGKKSFGSKPFNAAELRKENYIQTTSLIRREDFPGFDESLKRFQDWDLWLTMSNNGKSGVYVDQELFEVHQQKGRSNISQWLPSFMYKIPWKKIGWAPTAIKKHQRARAIIEQKHNL